MPDAEPLTEGERAEADLAEQDLADQELAEDGLDPERSSRALIVLLAVCAVGGLIAAMVLTIDRIRLLEDPQTQLGCNLSPFIACGPVMQSRAGALFGFPNPLLGIIGFSIVLTTAFALAAGARLRRWYWVGLQVGVVLAAVFITWLQTQSLYVIHALCLWCMLVWAITIPTVVAVTVDNLARGRLGAGGVKLGRRLRSYPISIVAVWYLIVLAAIGLRFYREFALFWFGVALS